MTSQYQFWNTTFSREDYYYGDEPGPVARRTVRYHRRLLGATALDIGCGEGQDLAYLTEQGYTATGIDFTPNGIAKTNRLLARRNLTARTQVVDLISHDWSQFEGQFDLVIAVNSLQFLGSAAPRAIQGALRAVAPGGVIGLSLYAPGELNSNRSDVFVITQHQLIALVNPDIHQPRFSLLETADLRQWHVGSNAAQPFTSLIAQRMNPSQIDENTSRQVEIE
jgi:SAM-dependent methyltransferase